MQTIQSFAICAILTELENRVWEPDTAVMFSLFSGYIWTISLVHVYLFSDKVPDATKARMAARFLSFRFEIWVSIVTGGSRHCVLLNNLSQLPTRLFLNDLLSTQANGKFYQSQHIESLYWWTGCENCLKLHNSYKSKVHHMASVSSYYSSYYNHHQQSWYEFPFVHKYHICIVKVKSYFPFLSVKF